MNTSRCFAPARGDLVLAAVGSMALAACGDASGPSTDGGIAYVTNFGSNTVSLIDIDVDTVVTTIDVGEGPYGVTATPDGRFVYVANFYSEDVTVIETAGNTVTATIATGGRSTLGLAADPSGNFVYQGLIGDLDAVAVISTATNTVTDMVEVGDDPHYIVFHPDGTRAYVSDHGSNDVSVIETASHTVTETIDLDGVVNEPYGTVLSFDGGLLYVTGEGTPGQIAVVETSTGDVVDIIGGAPHAVTIALTPGGSRAYVALRQIRVAVYDLPGGALLTTVPLEAFSLAVAGGGSSIYATSPVDGTVSVIDTDRNTIIRTIPVGEVPAGIAIVRMQN